MTVSAIQGKSGELWVNSGSATAFTKEACDQFSGTIYHITNTAKRAWDPATTPLVYGNDILVTTGYHVHAPIGQIHFDGAPTTPVTVSGKYYATSEVTFVQNWRVQFELGIAATYGLGAATGKTFVGLGVTGWTGSFDRAHESDTWQTKALSNGTKIIVKLYEDHSGSTTRVWAGFAVLTSTPITTPVEGLVVETVSFTGDGDLFYVTVET